MKKIYNKYLFFILSVFLTLNCINTVSAFDSIKKIQNNLSLANEYVLSNIEDLLIGITQGDIDLTKVKIQTPIKVGGDIDGEYYLYPIFVNNVVEYVCRVHYDGIEFVPTISERFSEEFQILFNQKQRNAYSLAIIKDNLVLIKNNGFNIWAKDKNEKQVFEKDIESYLSSSSLTHFENKIENIYFETKEDSFNNRNTRATYYLTIDYLNKQSYGGYPWCAGYVAANILRYMTGDRTIYASDIASFGNIATNESIPRSVIKQYANYMHQIIVTEYNGVANLTNTVLNYQLSRNRPIYGSFIENNNTSSAHAIVVHGFNGTMVNFRNPWNNFSETYKHNAYAFVDEYGTKWIQRGYMTFE